MLTTDTIARVILNITPSTASASSFDTGLILAPSTSFTTDKRLRVYTSAAAAAAGLISDGFAATSDPYRAAMKYFAASPAPARLLFSAYPASETPAEALDAVLEQTSAFYGVFLTGLTGTDAEILSAYLALEEHIRSHTKPMILFLPATGTPEEAVSDGSLLKALSDRATRRAVATYAASAPDAAAVMGTAMGLVLSHPDTAFTLCYKTISALVPSPLTETQVEAIKALGGNVYITRGYSNRLLENGSTPSGYRFDEVLYLDMISEDLRAAAISLLAGSDEKLPQTDDTTAQFINRFSSILASYADMGVLATSVWRGANLPVISYGSVLEKGFTLWADSYDDQSDADRAAHRAMPISIALTLAGSVESIVISINVSV